MAELLDVEGLGAVVPRYLDATQKFRKKIRKNTTVTATKTK